MDGQAQFDREAAERVLRRAIELSESLDRGAEVEGISERVLVEAADELGVDTSVVLQAVSEERLGLLQAPRRRADRLVGPPTITVIRIIDGPPDELLDRVDAWLRHVAPLRCQRRGNDTAEYLRRSDVAAGVQRAVRSFTGETDLRRVNRLSVSVRPVDSQRSAVALVADLRAERALALAGGSGVAGVGSAVSVVEVFVWSPWLWLGVPASLAAGAGVMRARTIGLGDVETALNGVLDRTEAGEGPVGVLSDVRRRLLGSTSSRIRNAVQSRPGGPTPGSR